MNGSQLETRIRAAIVGASGYGGCGTIELLLRHPGVEVARLIAQADAGKKISEVFPHLKGHCDLVIDPPDKPNRFDDIDVVFFSTPDGVGQEQAPAWVEKGIRVIDFSGDFRFADAGTYAGYAERIGKPTEHQAAALLDQSVYGVPELNADEIRTAQIVGNPGCFAIACILGLAPGLSSGTIAAEGLICDCKTGVSGAGKKLNAGFHYPARYENTNAYRIAKHQHIYEIETTLSSFVDDVKVTFTPHVIPMTRGILTTLYADLTGDFSALEKAYVEFYQNKPFVNVLGPGDTTSTMDVRGSNYCNIWLNHDPRTNKAIVVSHIDNLMKGQAGNAVQNMNLMMGFEETMGLDLPGQYP